MAGVAHGTLRRRGRGLLIACLTLASTLATIPAHTSSQRLPPLRLQTFTLASGDAPGQPSVAADPREGFVVTWQERVGDGHALRFAVLERDGHELRRGLIARGANWFVNWADFPSLVVLDNGDWVTHWLVRRGQAPEAYDTHLVRSRDRGRSWSASLLPHDDRTETQHGFVSLVPAGGDRVLALWLDGRRGAVDHVSAASPAAAAKSGSGHAHGDTMSLRSVLLDRRGVVAGSARELDDSTCSCCQTDAVRVGARTLVVYRDRTPDEIRDISVLELGARGEWLAPRNLHPDGWRIEGCPVNGPAIAAGGAQVLVVWPTAADGEMRTRYVLRAAAQMGRAGAARELAPGARMFGRVDAAALGEDFIVTWLGQGSESGGSALRLARLRRDGAVVGEQVVAALPSGRISGNPRLAALRDRALLVWVQPAVEGRAATLHAALLRR